MLVLLIEKKKEGIMDVGIFILAQFKFWMGFNRHAKKSLGRVRHHRKYFGSFS